MFRCLNESWKTVPSAGSQLGAVRHAEVVDVPKLMAKWPPCMSLRPIQERTFLGRLYAVRTNTLFVFHAHAVVGAHDYQRDASVFKLMHVARVVKKTPGMSPHVKGRTQHFRFLADLTKRLES